MLFSSLFFSCNAFTFFISFAWLFTSSSSHTWTNDIVLFFFASFSTFSNSCSTTYAIASSWLALFFDNSEDSSSFALL